MKLRVWAALAAATCGMAQEPSAAPAAPVAAGGPEYRVEAGTKVLLSLVRTLSTKNAVEGDRVYLETAFPVIVDGKVVIPPGSYVNGTVTEVKRPGRVKGRGELFVRFDMLMLGNGVTRDFRGRIGGLDGAADEKLDPNEGKVTGEGGKGEDAKRIGEVTAAGASVGGIAGGLSRTGAGRGLGLGAAGGAAVGLATVLLTRGPDIMLERGSTMEMVLDRPLVFTMAELDFSNVTPRSGRPVMSPQLTRRP